MATDNKLQAIIAHCKEYGFIFQSSDIYDGLSAVYDYGQMGVELKKNGLQSLLRTLIKNWISYNGSTLKLQNFRYQ